MIPLARYAFQIRPFERLLADAGYDSEANHRFCREELGVESLILAKKRRSVTVIAGTPYRRMMVDRLGTPGDPQARRVYAQRWKAETLVPSNANGATPLRLGCMRCGRFKLC